VGEFQLRPRIPMTNHSRDAGSWEPKKRNILTLEADSVSSTRMYVSVRGKKRRTCHEGTEMTVSPSYEEGDLERGSTSYKHHACMPSKAENSWRIGSCKPDRWCRKGSHVWCSLSLARTGGTSPRQRLMKEAVRGEIRKTTNIGAGRRDLGSKGKIDQLLKSPFSCGS